MMFTLAPFLNNHRIITSLHFHPHRFMPRIPYLTYTLILTALIFLLLIVISHRNPPDELPAKNMPPKPPLNVQSFPRPPFLERTSRLLQIKWDEQLVAETDEAYWVLETTHPPSEFFFGLSQNTLAGGILFHCLHSYVKDERII